MDNSLNDKQLKFIDVYFKEQDIGKICKTLKITRQTYYNYLNDDAIKQEINNIRCSILSNTTHYLQSCLDECSKELMSIIKDKNTAPQIKINAINSVFNNCNKLTEQVDVLTKIAEIEQRLKDAEDRDNES
jgi:hypothetical protein